MDVRCESDEGVEEGTEERDAGGFHRSPEKPKSKVGTTEQVTRVAGGRRAREEHAPRGGRLIAAEAQPAGEQQRDDGPVAHDGDRAGRRAQEERTEKLTRDVAFYAQHKQLGAAQDCFDALAAEGLTPSRYSYSNLINAFVNSGDVAGAEEVLQRMRVRRPHGP